MHNYSGTFMSIMQLMKIGKKDFYSLDINSNSFMYILDIIFTR